jgi:hypothetical protein
MAVIVLHCTGGAIVSVVGNVAIDTAANLFADSGL